MKKSNTTVSICAIAIILLIALANFVPLFMHWPYVLLTKVKASWATGSIVLFLGLFSIYVVYMERRDSERQKYLALNSLILNKLMEACIDSKLGKCPTITGVIGIDVIRRNIQVTTSPKSGHNMFFFMHVDGDFAYFSYMIPGEGCGTSSRFPLEKLYLFQYYKTQQWVKFWDSRHAQREMDKQVVKPNMSNIITGFV